jgi:hypothetical protein
MQAACERRGSRHTHTMTPRLLRLPAGAAVALLVLCGLGQLPASAKPNPRHAIAHADSTGPIVIDSSGHGYLTWERVEAGTNGDPIMFCKIPRGGACKHQLKLPLPAGAKWDNYDVSQPFPVLGGKHGVVLVVGPSYVYGNVVVWTSGNGGSSFSLPQIIPNPSYADLTGVDDVLRAPNNSSASLNYFSIASHNPGLGYTFTGTGAIGASAPPYGFEFDTDHVPGAVIDATLGFSGQQTIEAFSTDASRPRLDYFWSPLAGVSGSPGTLEHGPTQITIGSNPRLASGTKGLFLLSADNGSKPSKPLRLHVRRWKRSTHSFGAPVLVGTVRNDINATNPGGFTETSAGTLVVAWPGYAAHDKYVMHVWTSKNGGRTFAGPTTVAKIGFGYAGPARVAAKGGSGFLTFQDNNGLELVDLSHL